MSRVNCCVVGCSNSYKKCPAGTVFYSFPADIRFPGRKELWIRAVKRTTSDNKDWIPSKNARICSQHFIGGKRSDHPHHPNYIPSVFPKSYRKPAANPSKVSRFERTLKRGELKDKTAVLVNPNESTDTMEHDISNEIACGSESPITHVSIGVNCCLTSDLPASEESNVAFLSCCIFDGAASTQTFIPVTKILKDQVTQTSVLRKNANLGGDPDPEKETIEDFPTGFQGLDSVTSDEKLSAISGVSFAVFFVLLNIVKENLPLKAPKIQIEDRLLIFLMKMKLGISHFALAVIFGVHRTTVSRIFDQILDVLVMKTLNWVYWPSKAKVRHTLPEAFKEKYRNCRAIIDCTEIKTECPPTVEQQVLMYSTYKGDYTVKFLVAITPSGFISFISNGYGGRAGDCFITNDCGILNLVEKGDLYLADKGFPTITSVLGDKNALLVMPPFAHGDQFTKEECERTYEIASVRIHVERGIQRMKIFNILHKVESEQLPIVDKIVRMCCVLANMQNPIIKN